MIRELGRLLLGRRWERAAWVLAWGCSIAALIIHPHQAWPWFQLALVSACTAFCIVADQLSAKWEAELKRLARRAFWWNA